MFFWQAALGDYQFVIPALRRPHMMDQRVQHVVSFIRNNYQRKLTLREMADTVNLSTWWLCHLFKADLGTSPERFLAKVRLEKAKVLLEESFLSVKEIMADVGMSDAGHFSRSFKAAYGLTPAKWRETSQEHKK
jgi:transcriptional regulator GlxA family with amidase domain